MKRFLLSFVLLLAAHTGFAAVPVYVWQGWDDTAHPARLAADFAALKAHGVTGVCFNAGFDTVKTAVAARAAHAAGLEYHAWTPCMLQGAKPATWYAVNRLGVRADIAPPYVPYYTTLDPHNPEVRAWLVEQCAAVARVQGVDFVQLDYIRFPDVILARGLWQKYGLVMHEEYPAADYCYCDDCVADFGAQTGIDIRAVSDPAKVPTWARFRQRVITTLVAEIAAAVRAEGKRLSADVFPGPNSHAAWMVRQQWDMWDLDAVFPMNYNDFYLQPPSWVGTITREAVRAADGRFPVISGLFVCKDWRDKHHISDPEGWGLSPDELKSAVRRSLRAGAQGICLFSASSITEEHWQALAETIDR